MTWIYESKSVEATLALGKALGERLSPGALIGLIGTLGSGKTCFIKGLALGLGLQDPDVVTSPTFVLLNNYVGRCPLRHFDLYRLESGSGIIDLGLYDLLPQSVVVVEWADRIPRESVPEMFRIEFDVTGETTRRITFHPGSLHQAFVNSLATDFALTP